MVYWNVTKTGFENLQKTLEDVTNNRFRVLTVFQEPATAMTAPLYVVIAYKMKSNRKRQWRDSRDDNDRQYEENESSDTQPEHA
ncbi:hypothetical protein HYV49_01145 [Candidatus Pacearchaeota archaeon]|nr:hypothetical protein [Candidatus Pacearchaeota archaeon]